MGWVYAGGSRVLQHSFWGWRLPRSGPLRAAPATEHLGHSSPEACPAHAVEQEVDGVVDIVDKRDSAIGQHLPCFQVRVFVGAPEETAPADEEGHGGGGAQQEEGADAEEH